MLVCLKNLTATNIECLVPHFTAEAVVLSPWWISWKGNDLDAVEALNKFIQESHNKCRSESRRYHSSTCNSYKQKLPAQNSQAQNHRRFRYIYYIYMQGFLSSETTWELPSNMSKNLLDAYIWASLLQKQYMVENEPRKHGLSDRITRKEWLHFQHLHIIVSIFVLQVWQLRQLQLHL